MRRSRRGPSARFALQARLESDLLEVRRGGVGEGPSLAREGSRVRARAGSAQRRASRHVLPRAADDVLGGGGGHGSAAVPRARGAADGAREASLAELGGDQRGAGALRVVDGAPARLRLHHAADLSLARVRFPDREDVATLRRQRLRFGLVFGEISRSGGGFDGLVLLGELHVHVDDVMSGGARQQRGRRAALVFGVGFGADVRVLFALVRDFPLGARVQRSPGRGAGLRTQARHRQLEGNAR